MFVKLYILMINFIWPLNSQFFTKKVDFKYFFAKVDFLLRGKPIFQKFVRKSFQKRRNFSDQNARKIFWKKVKNSEKLRKLNEIPRKWSPKETLWSRHFPWPPFSFWLCFPVLNHVSLVFLVRLANIIANPMKLFEKNLKNTRKEKVTKT